MGILIKKEKYLMAETITIAEQITTKKVQIFDVLRVMDQANQFLTQKNKDKEKLVGELTVLENKLVKEKKPEPKK